MKQVRVLVSSGLLESLLKSPLPIVHAEWDLIERALLLTFWDEHDEVLPKSYVDNQVVTPIIHQDRAYWEWPE